MNILLIDGGKAFGHIRKANSTTACTPSPSKPSPRLGIARKKP